jgi:Holliday junction resolvase-like predicted endonuclease
VADLLDQQGFEIIDRNWKTKVCEIDIVAEKSKVIFFVEVKYRSSQAQGSGFEYVANQKLKRMNFAAEIWRQTYKWSGDYRLMAASVSGVDCQNIEIIELD